MRIAVFGASGRTGRQVVQAAARAGHDVLAVSRSGRPASGAADAAGATGAMGAGGAGSVRWRAADVRDAEAVDRIVAEVDAVISAVGVGRERAETNIYSAGVYNIAKAMRRHDVRRLAVVSATPVGPARQSPWLQRILVRPMLWRFFGASYRDMQRMETELERRPQLDAVVLRPPYLRDAAPKGEYRVDPDRPVSGGNSITTGDLAAALLAAVARPVPPWRTAYVAN
ncbi:NAD(P)-dependent oxidoreductase [Nakamurella aerolata]|uniref:NAD(P)H-binding protein n=1 Tax=Nakamurella aerolata TaxID=1656892 RepID=A0A849A759_9ACTN|nr:NAD(P)H-binding protein [Nakamurella aerolata]NNG36804.1 NAD(P)H-binding protein [Nakamurella aerolata]